MKYLLFESAYSALKKYGNKFVEINERAYVHHTTRDTRVPYYEVQDVHARATHNSIVEGIPCLLEDLASSWLGFSFSSSLVDYTWCSAFVTMPMSRLRIRAWGDVNTKGEFSKESTVKFVYQYHTVLYEKCWKLHCSNNWKVSWK